MHRHYNFGKLFAEPSFAEGAARLLDFGNTLQEYNDAGSEAHADVQALREDWEAVGSDLQTSIQTYGHERKRA